MLFNDCYAARMALRTKLHSNSPSSPAPLSKRLKGETPRLRRTQTERREETRRKVLQAAIDLLRDKGYAGLSTVEVAKIAGVSRGALTHHYPSKEILAAGAIQDEFGRSVNKAQLRAMGIKTVEQALKAILEDCQDFYFNGFFRISIEVVNASGSDSEIAARVREISASTRAPVEATWAKTLVDTGVPANTAEDIVWLTASMVRGLAVRKLMLDEPTRFRRLTNLWRKIIAEHLSSVSV